MRSKSLHILVFLLLVPTVLISCGTKPLPGTEPEKQTLKPRKGVVVFQSPSSSSLEGKATQVFVSRNTDGSQILVIGSASFYDWMEDVKKTLAKEKRENMNDACLKLLNIGQTEPEALDIDYKVDMECASVPQGEASHTDPSPLDDTDSWVLCKARQSGPGSSGPGGDPGDPGVGPGGDSGGEPDGGDDQGSGSATVDALTEILCTPAVRVQPGVDPRLIYPAPDQVEAVVANLAPCVEDFCPFEIVIGTPDPGDPTEPIDPSPDDTQDLDETFKDKLMCDKFRGLCEPDITLISKNDLAKGDDDDSGDGDKPEGACDDKCDGVCGGKAGESCTQGNVGSKDEDWVICSGTEIAPGSVCVEHKKNDKGESEYTVTHSNGVDGDRPSLDDQLAREDEGANLVGGFEDDTNNCTTGNIDSPQNENRTSITYTCP